MFEWLMVAAFGFGTFGVAVLLHAWGYHCWQKHGQGTRLADRFTKATWGMATAAGMGLICLGFVLGTLPRWEAVFWAGLCVLWAWRCLRFAFSR